MMAMVLTSLSVFARLARARRFRLFISPLLLFFCAARMASRARARSFVVAYVRGETQGNPNSTDLPTYHPVFLPSCFEEPLQMDTYLPIYLLALLSNTGRFHWLSKKRDLRNQKEKGRSFFPFSFLFFELCHYCWQMGSVSSPG
jgi:hypothetical protein